MQRNKTREWIMLIRGLGLCFGTILVYAQFWIPRTDPLPDAWVWALTTSTKQFLGPLLMLPWRIIHARIIWWALVGSLVLFAVAFQMDQLPAIIRAFRFGSAGDVAGLLFLFVLFGTVLLSQVVVIWKIRADNSKDST